MNETPIKIGWFSAKQAAGYGTVIYAGLDDREVEVSEIKDDSSTASSWDDAVSLGVVGRFMRQGRSCQQYRQSLDRKPGCCGNCGMAREKHRGKQ